MGQLVCKNQFFLWRHSLKPIYRSDLLCCLVLYPNTNYCAKFQVMLTISSISMVAWKSKISDCYSSVPNCRGGHFAIFEILLPQNHFIMTLWLYFINFLPKRAKTFIFLGVFTKITPKSPYYDPPILWIFLRGVDPPAYSTPPYN